MADANIFNDIGKIDEFLKQQTTTRMTEQGLSYGAAFAQIISENGPLLALRERLYQKRENEGHDSSFYKLVQGQLLKIDNEITGLIAETRKEHPELTGAQAMTAALSEHPDVCRRREELMSQLDD
jgi:predicted ATPase